MKRIIAALAAGIMMLTLCACGGNGTPAATPAPTSVPEISPAQVLTVEDASALVGYTLVQEGDVLQEDGAKAVFYRSEPVGAKDTVKVIIHQYSTSVSKDDIKSEFTDRKAKRPKAVDVEGIPDCYIAYPSVTFYEDGYLVQIFAGSGSDDAQKTLLVSAAQKAKANLENLIK